MTKQVIVITGAASGIGQALSRALAGSISTPSDKDLMLEIPEAALADVKLASSMLGLADLALTRHGALDIWLHCAGQGINRRALALTDEDIREMVSINVLGTMNGLRACLPYFKRAGHGHFIAISSALVGEPERSPHRSAYTASKAAMEILLRIAQAEIAEEYPAISIQCPRLPGVNTNFSRNALHASPGAVSTSPTLLSAEEAAKQVISLLSGARHVLSDAMMDNIGT